MEYCTRLCGKKINLSPFFMTYIHNGYAFFVQCGHCSVYMYEYTLFQLIGGHYNVFILKIYQNYPSIGVVIIISVKFRGGVGPFATAHHNY